jgi:hypothetical protein
MKDIKEFLEDDENSSNSAGKKEYVKRGGKKMQKRYLNDSLYNLHKKFIRSCGYSLSFASFCRFRPFWIVQASKRPLENCLCATHENFRLLVSALYKYKMISCKSPAEVLQQICCDPLNTLCLLKKCDGCKENGLLYGEFDNSIDVVYWKWGTRTQTIKCKNGKNKLVRLVKKEQHEIKPLQAVEYFETLLPNYIVHCGKIVNQQRAMAEVKRVLTPGEAIMHIDFSENYKCQYFKEIQSAHFLFCYKTFLI